MRFPLCLLLGLVIMSRAGADDLRPLYIEIVTGPGPLVETRVKRPPQIPLANQPWVALPDFCQPLGVPGREASVRRYQCEEALAGEVLQVQWPVYPVNVPVIIKTVFEEGQSDTVALDRTQNAWTMPSAPGAVPVQYTRLGIEHIWVGYDHLLFLLCLVWIAWAPGRVLWMVTGFTLAHSVTLALATFDVVRVPVPWVEAVIALSVLFLALEITRGRRDTLTWRYPVAVSSSIGLLHGLGFAAVLADIGLPDGQAIAGLLFFNLGVEIGQLIFVALVYGLMQLAARAGSVSSPARLQPVAGYFVGCISSWWLLDRVTAFAG